MNESQQLAIKTFLDGHNFCLTGQAGSGKTFAVKKMEELVMREKSVAITCTTGLACMQYSKAKTIHSWAGLQDGRFSLRELLQQVENNEKFIDCKSNILSTDSLIIDEISMLSRQLFEQLEGLCRAIRKTNIAFGGIQVVAVGDFYQLQPVPSVYGDTGEPCLTSDIWKTVFPHHINLTQVVRQHEEELVNAVRELARGDPSPETNNLMLRLARPLSRSDNTVQLCARNIDVDYKNDQVLASLKENLCTFEAVDSGDKAALKKIKIQKTVTIKKGCKVVLLVNLTYPLVNGLGGKVVDIDQTGPLVYFPELNITKKIERYQFTIYNREKKSNSASRFQIPLKLSYALTIHRSQGMTLESVIVDCRGASKPGQIAVAVGRAKTTEGLRVINYHPSLATKPSDVILKHYNNTETNKDITQSPSTCCQNKMDPFTTIKFTDQCSESDSEFSDFNSNEISEIDHIFGYLDAQAATEGAGTTESPGTTPSTSLMGSETDTFDAIGIATSLLYSDPVTEQQEKLNNIIQSAIENVTDFRECAVGVCGHIKALYDKCVVMSTKRKMSEQLKDQPGSSSTLPKTTSSKSLNKFNSEVFSFMNRIESDETFKSIFPFPTADEITFCSKFVLKTVQHVIELNVASVESDKCSGKSNVKSMSEDGSGKVRYVGGMCVAKLKYKLMKEYHVKIHSKQNRKKKEAEQCQQQIQQLEAMESSYAQLITDSMYTKSLYQTQRKQNERCSLTNISDKAFEFFMELESERVSISTKQATHKHKQNVLSYLTEKVLGQEMLKRKFLDVVLHTEPVDKSTQDLFEKIVKKYMSVGNNTFRQQMLREFAKKKTLAHRVQISTHKKSAIEKTGQKPSTSVEKVTPSTEEEVNLKRKGKGKGKTSKKKKAAFSADEELFYCPTCGKLYQQDQDWIECGNCLDWFDRKCSKLVSETDWNSFVETDKKWLCGNCLVSQKI